MKTTPHHTTYITRVLPMFALLMLSSHAVFAQSGSTQWTGSTSTDFYDGTNWANGQYPNGNTTFVDSALTGAANTTVDRSSGTARYIFGLYFLNTLGTDNSYTINGSTRFDMGGSVIRTAEVTSGSLTDVINADIADTGTADVWDIRANHHLDMNGVYSGSNTTTKVGDGILTFAGANTYTGATSIEGGKLLISGDSASTEFTVGSGATLELASGYRIAGGASGVATFTGGGTLLVSGNISGQADQLKMSMDSGATINIQGGGSLTYGSGGDEWTGNLADVINNGNMYGAANSFIIDKLDGSGSMTMGSGTINLGVDNGDGGVFNGSIGRNYADAHINKQGTGTQTLNGSVNMGSSGTVTVSGGTLVFNGTSSGSNATGSWIVQNGATLSGSGTLSGTATIGDGATLSPGNSPGTQTFDNLTWVNGGTYLWEINADLASGGGEGVDSGWDWIDVTNTFDLSGITTGFNIDITSLTNPGNIAGLADGFDYSGKSYLDPYESFTILSFGSLTGDFDASEFNLLTGNFANPKVDWSLDIVGNDLVLNAVFVPEPSSTALLGLGGLALMLRRKRS